MTVVIIYRKFHVLDENHYEFLTSVFTYLLSIKMLHLIPTSVVEQIFISACLVVF